jgi:hypothetical protein
MTNTGRLHIDETCLRHCCTLHLQHLGEHGSRGVVEFPSPPRTKHRHVLAVGQFDLFLLLDAIGLLARAAFRGRLIFLACFFQCIVGKICHKNFGARRHLPSLLIAHHAAHAVLLAQQESRNGDLVVEIDQILLLEDFLGMVGGLVRIAGQEPLIEPGVRFEDGLVAKQVVEKFELRNVSAKHDETHRQRR